MASPLNAASPVVVVVRFKGRDITAELLPLLKRVAYTDHLHGQSDEIELHVNNSDRRWLRAWHPKKGDLVDVSIGREGGPLLACGEFELDDNEFDLVAGTAVLKGLGTGISTAARTRRTVAYRGKTLHQVAGEVGARHGFTVKGLEGQRLAHNLTQNNEADLAFLERIAKAFGYAFAVRGRVLQFHHQAAIAEAAPVLTLEPENLSAGSLRDKAGGVYRACVATYLDPRSRKVHRVHVDAPGVANGDVLQLTERCESKAHAEARAKAALVASDRRQVEGSWTHLGDPRIVAGQVVRLANADALSGAYTIKVARHTAEPGAAWDVEAEVARVAA